MALLCHSSERRLPWHVSRQYRFEFQDPTGQTCRSHNRRLGSRRLRVSLYEPGIGDGTTSHLFVLGPDWTAVGGRHVQALSAHRPLHVSQGPSCVLQRRLPSGGKGRLSVDRDRRADKTGWPRPISGYSEVACCGPSFSSSAISRMKTGPAYRLLAEGYSVLRRLLNKPGRLRQCAIKDLFCQV